MKSIRKVFFTDGGIENKNTKLKIILDHKKQQLKE
jgi:adenosylmethionine-8-amino-7-oxononanoate aminotransferase